MNRPRPLFGTFAQPQLEGREDAAFPQVVVRRLPALVRFGLGIGLLLGVCRLDAQPWDPGSTVRGEELARQVCQACHLLPTPDLLDKRTWAEGTLRRMATFLGVARISFDTRPDGEILRAAKIFPDEPLLSEPDWVAIRDYFLRSAPATALPQGPRDPIRPGLDRFRAEPLLHAATEPAITLVRIEPGTGHLFLGDARRQALHEFSGEGRWIGSTKVDSAPVALTRDGENTYLTLIGEVFPSDLANGQIVRLQPQGTTYAVAPLLQGLKRPVACDVADLDGDGRRDLLVGQYGNYLGRLGWFADRGSGRLVEESLVDFPGAIRTEIRDVNADGRPDVVALLAQAREGVYLFRNEGGGAFGWDPLVRFPPVYGVTYFELVDFDADGDLDLLVTNGDNGEYASPFKRYHGIRLFRNDGHWRFAEAWFYPLNGAFKAVARDFDGDGDLDLAAISFFPDYERSPEESFVYLENRGGLTFTASSPAAALDGRWLTLDAGDLDGDGDLDLVLGSFVDGPRGTPIPPALQQRWHDHRIPALILRNQTIPNAGPAAAAGSTPTPGR